MATKLRCAHCHSFNQEKALQRLHLLSLDKCQAITSRSSSFYGNPLAYALHRFSFYQCFKCKVRPPAVSFASSLTLYPLYPTGALLWWGQSMPSHPHHTHPLLHSLNLRYWLVCRSVRQTSRHKSSIPENSFVVVAVISLALTNATSTDASLCMRFTAHPPTTYIPLYCSLTIIE